MSTLQVFANQQTARTPNYRMVIRNQFRLIDASRRLVLLFLFITAGIAVMINEKLFAAPLDVAPIPVLMLAAMIWPFFVWRGETRTRRTYHRWLPVDQVAHDFAKLIAGAIWLAVACVLTLGTLKAMTLFFRPAELWTMAELLGIVMGALLVYGFFSLLPILSDKPVHWLVAVWPLSYLAGAGLNQLGIWGNYVATVFFDEPLGANIAILGALALRNEPRNLLGFLPYMATWLLALALWLVLMVCALYLASRWANRSSEA
jgi:hypothetical protein